MISKKIVVTLASFSYVLLSILLLSLTNRDDLMIIYNITLISLISIYTILFNCSAPLLNLNIIIDFVIIVPFSWFTTVSEMINNNLTVLTFKTLIEMTIVTSIVIGIFIEGINLISNNSLGNNKKILHYITLTIAFINLIILFVWTIYFRIFDKIDIRFYYLTTSAINILIMSISCEWYYLDPNVEHIYNKLFVLTITTTLACFINLIVLLVFFSSFDQILSLPIIIICCVFLLILPYVAAKILLRIYNMPVQNPQILEDDDSGDKRGVPIVTVDIASN